MWDNTVQRIRTLDCKCGATHESLWDTLYPVFRLKIAALKFKLQIKRSRIPLHRIRPAWTPAVRYGLCWIRRSDCCWKIFMWQCLGYTRFEPRTTSRNYRWSWVGYTRFEPRHAALNYRWSFVGYTWFRTPDGSSKLPMKLCGIYMIRTPDCSSELGYLWSFVR